MIKENGGDVCMIGNKKYIVTENARNIVVSHNIIVPRDGHLRTVTSELLPAQSAFQKVSAENTAYAFAEKPDDENIVLHRYSYQCFGCRQSFTLPNVNRVDFLDWALQLSLPGFQKEDKPFKFQPMPEEGKSVQCPHCKNSAPIILAARTTTYIVHADSSSISISQQIEHANKYYDLPYNFANNKNCSYPVQAKLCFDHITHRSYFTVVNCDGESVISKNITEQVTPLQGFSIAKHLNTDTELKTVIISAFISINGDDLPFHTDEINLETLAMLNRFPGYPRSFYDAIPYAYMSRKIDNSFKKIANRIGEYRNIGDLYSDLGLPNKKQLKKTVMENPALLFYANELKALPFQNYDVVLQIIKSDDVFKLLAYLRYLPGLRLFLEQFIAAKGETTAWNAVSKRIHVLPQLAAYYLILPQSQHEKLLRDPYRESYNTTPTFNWPVSQKYDVNIPDEQINEYSFVALRNNADYQKTARELRNCLASCTDLRVFCILLKKQRIGAVEIRGNKIHEAKLSNNEPIEENKEVFKAFISWANKNNLEYVERERRE